MRNNKSFYGLVQLVNQGSGALREGHYPLFFIYTYRDGTPMGYREELVRNREPIVEGVDAMLGAQISLNITDVRESYQALHIETERGLNDHILETIMDLAYDIERNDLTFPFRLNVMASDIARKTRRGPGNVVVCSNRDKFKIQEMCVAHPSGVQLWEAVAANYTFLQANVDDVYVGYVGGVEADRCIAIVRHGPVHLFYRHPYAFNYWCKTSLT